jgi:hypothetical protein
VTAEVTHCLGGVEILYFVIVISSLSIRLQ